MACLSRYAIWPSAVLTSLVEQSAAWLRAIEDDQYAGDSTGFSTAVYDRWFSQKHGKLCSQKLGDDYRPRGVKDDTMMKIDAAEERIAEGAIADGAAVLLRMLETRLQLYVQKHGPDLR
jgi:hypothetical protein